MWREAAHILPVKAWAVLTWGSAWELLSTMAANQIRGTTSVPPNSV